MPKGTVILVFGDREEYILPSETRGKWVPESRINKAVVESARDHNEATAVYQFLDKFTDRVLSGPKAGKWALEIHAGRTYETCSICGCTHVLLGEREEGTQFCPKCGSYMIESEFVKSEED